MASNDAIDKALAFQASGSTPIPNQSNFQDPQNFEINIDKMYSDFIQEIDASRSIINIANQGNQIILNTLKKETIAGITKLLKAEETPQESRCHTFYRIIGFPVIASDKKRYYNPGFDITQNKDTTIKLSDKIDIANNPLNGFRAISSIRENYVNGLLKTFSTNASITASTLSLSSSTQVRKFIAPLSNNDKPFEFTPVDQSYTASFNSVIGKNDRVLLTDYVDELGNKPDKSQLHLTRFHFIKPFIVDPRIDFSVNPASRKIGVPFVSNKSLLLVGEQTFVKRPLLEKIIRERFSQRADNSSLSTSQQKVVDYVLNVPTIVNDQLIQQMSSDVYKLGELPRFAKYLQIIKAMMIKLVDAQKAIHVAQSLYYWMPIPSNIGPEGGSEVKGVVISQEIPDGSNNSFIPKADRSIINLTLKQTANQFNAQTANVSGTPDIGGFAFEGFRTTFDQDTSQSLGDIATASLNTLNRKRSHDLKIASQALRTIEIIMGEFSGLGLCDIIAIMGALYLMPKEDLVGFLDNDAFLRAISQGVLPPLTNPGIDKAQNGFIERVKDFYNLMDKIYLDLRQTNGLG